MSEILMKLRKNVSYCFYRYRISIKTVRKQNEESESIPKLYAFFARLKQCFCKFHQKKSSKFWQSNPKLSVLILTENYFIHVF